MLRSPSMKAAVEGRWTEPSYPTVEAWSGPTPSARLSVPDALSSIGRAVYAERRLWASVQAGFSDRIAALDAVPVHPVVEAGERVGQLLEAQLGAPLLGLSHRLLLQGVHPRQPAHRRLIEVHRLSLGAGAHQSALELGAGCV